MSTLIEEEEDGYGPSSPELNKSHENERMVLNGLNGTYEFQKKKEVDPLKPIGWLKKLHDIQNLEWKPGGMFGSEVTLGQALGGLTFAGSICTADWGSRFSQLKENVTTCFNSLKNNISSISPEAWTGIAAAGLVVGSIYAYTTTSRPAGTIPELDTPDDEDIDAESHQQYSHRLSRQEKASAILHQQETQERGDTSLYDEEWEDGESQVARPYFVETLSSRRDPSLIRSEQQSPGRRRRPRSRDRSSRYRSDYPPSDYTAPLVEAY